VIKINLLPAYILERRQVRRLMQTFVVLAIVLVVVIVGVTYGYARSTEKVKNDVATNYAAGRTRAKQLDSDIKVLQGDQASRIDVFLKFYDEVLDHNDKIAGVLETINRYIFKAVVVKEMELENDQFKLKGRIDSNANLARFYENLRRCPALVADTVKIDKVPVFPVQRTTEEGTSGGGTSTPYGRPSGSTTPYGPPSGSTTPYAPPSGSAVPSGTPPAVTYPGTSATTPGISPEFFDQPRIVRIPRYEYEFEVTATLTPQYAIPPPVSPLGGGTTQDMYGTYPQGPTGGAAPPGPGGASAPSGTTGPRGTGGPED
jgi:Tfp pilus assembly protein PilN